MYKKVLCGIVAAIFSCALSQAVELGSVSFARADTPPLRMSRSAGPIFYRRTGGVAFGNEATLKGGLEIVDLKYDPAVPDGKRLVISVRDASQAARDVRASLFDWELVPIARFSLDTNDGAFTYFGQAKTESETVRYRKQGYQILNYHSALKDTLLGLRLMQLDFLLIGDLAESATKIPRESGKPILGAGEKAFISNASPTGNVDGYEVKTMLLMSQYFESSRSVLKQTPYQSYVVGDFGRGTVVSLGPDGSLRFSGRLYWYFWNDPGGGAAEAAFNTEVKNFNAQVNAYNLSLRKLTESQIVAQQARIEKAEQELARKQSALESRPVTPQLELSRQLNDFISASEGLNPLIYRAGERTMHYSALFRYFKARNSQAYSSFVRSLDSVNVTPVVQTPTLVKP